ncbi:brain protein I3-like [Pectinophora gossypiella]|uniref:brain protein I3-like n=1 Tax=Pectinophora gossypiella TaxID=13191 RepID=UPI00214EF698|nr:brain protein I3-like [Pectinophora gossypiella]
MEKPTVTEQPPPYSATYPQGPQPQVHPQPQAQPGPGGAYPPPGGAYPPPPPGYTPFGTTPSAPSYVPNYGATNIIIPPPIIAVGACPACRVGILEDDFTCLGILCAILFFPLGILCCLALKNRRCSNCGALFG